MEQVRVLVSNGAKLMQDDLNAWLAENSEKVITRVTQCAVPDCTYVTTIFYEEKPVAQPMPKIPQPPAYSPPPKRKK